MDFISGYAKLLEKSMPIVYLLIVIIGLWMAQYWPQVKQFLHLRKRLIENYASIPEIPSSPVFGFMIPAYRSGSRAIMAIVDAGRALNADTFKVSWGHCIRICVTDPRDYKIIIESPKATGKDMFYSFLHPLIGNSLLTGKETKLNSKTKKINFPDFSLIREDRTAKAGGGVAVAIHKTLSHRTLPHDLLSLTEYVGVEVQVNNKKTKIYSIYNPPDVSIDTNLLRHLFSDSTPTIIVGDFNAKDTAWTSARPNESGLSYRSHKKLMVPFINGAKLMPDHIKGFNKQSRILIERLANKVGGKEFNMHHPISLCVADITFETLFGVSGEAQNGQSNAVLDRTEKVLEVTYTRGLSVWLWPNMIFHRLAAGKKWRDDVIQIHKVLDNIIAEKKMEFMKMQDEGVQAEPKTRAAFDHIIFHGFKTNWTDEDMRNEMCTVFLGSHDSLVAVIGFACLMLAMFPDYQDKVRAEIKNTCENNDISEEDGANLKYLDMVLRETIRLYPVGPVMARKITDDLQLTTVTLPKGAEVMMLPYSTHRDPKHWQDPDKFLPERFSPENSKERHPWAYVPYSGGIRACPGYKYGMMCMKIVIAHIIRRYQLGTTLEYEKLNIHAYLSVRSMDGFPIILKAIEAH